MIDRRPGSAAKAIRMVVMVGLTVALHAETAAWSYTPLVAYDDEAATLELAPATAADGWQALDPRANAVAAAPAISAGRLTVVIAPRGLGGLRLQAADGRICALEFVRPGEAHDLSVASDGGLRRGDVRVVLVLPRLEARADRRWELLRVASDHNPRPCTLTLPAPVVAEGAPALTALVRDSQVLPVRGQGVLVELAASDRLAGWKHREYRQCLAWLVADLQLRGATHLALAPPIAARPRDDDLQPLRRQVADVTNAYRCQLVDLAALGAAEYWEVSPGVLGQVLNARGEARRAALLAPWQTP